MQIEAFRSSTVDAGPPEKNIGLMIFHPDLHIGGAERQIVNLVKGLSSTDRYQVVIALYEQSGPLVSEVVDLPGVKVVEVGRFRKHPFSVLTSLVDLITEEGCTVLYTFLVGPSLAGTILKLTRRIRVFVWGNRISSFNMFEFGARGVIAHWLARTCIRMADMVVSNNDAGLQTPRMRYLETGRKVLIYNGIDTSVFFRSAERRTRARAVMELEPETIAIAFVGRVVVWKGVDVFIEAAKLLKASAASVKFVVIGGGEAEFLKTLQESAKQYGLQEDFLWMGPRRDVELLLNGIDVLTVCSKTGEGFPNIIGEAMASGTVVVATDVGDNRSIIRNDQLIVPPNDPTRISAVWQFLLDNLGDHSKFERDGITLSSKLYSVEHMVNQTDRMLTDLVSLQDER